MHRSWLKRRICVAFLRCSSAPISVTYVHVRALMGAHYALNCSHLRRFANDVHTSHFCVVAPRPFCYVRQCTRPRGYLPRLELLVSPPFCNVTLRPSWCILSTFCKFGSRKDRETKTVERLLKERTKRRKTASKLTLGIV